MSAKKATTQKKTDATTQGTKAQKTRAAKAPASSGGKSGKLSALDAAARVLGEEGRSMNCKELIETMPDHSDDPHFFLWYKSGSRYSIFVTFEDGIVVKKNYVEPPPS